MEAAVLGHLLARNWQYVQAGLPARFRAIDCWLRPLKSCRSPIPLNAICAGAASHLTLSYYFFLFLSLTAQGLQSDGPQSPPMGLQQDASRPPGHNLQPARGARRGCRARPNAQDLRHLSSGCQESCTKETCWKSCGLRAFAGSNPAPCMPALS